MLQAPLNPNGRRNVDVVCRLYDINDIVGRDSDRWAVNFGTGYSEHQAALYEQPFRIVTDRVVPFRNDPEKCRPPGRSARRARAGAGRLCADAGNAGDRRRKGASGNARAAPRV
jgi:hypothetical protein